MDEARRRDKLDDALLFVMGSVGILFGVVQVFVGFSTLLQVIAPVVLLGWILPFYFGFVRGAIRDSMVDRYRGWIYLVIGLTLYSIILAVEELSPFVGPNLQFVIPLGFVPLLILFMLRVPHFRRFILGPGFPKNLVLSRAATNAAAAAGVIAAFGSLFAVAKFTSVFGLIFAVPLAAIAIVSVAFFMFRSRRWASKVDLRYTIVTKTGRYYGRHGVELTARIVRILVLASLFAGTVLIVIDRYFVTDPALLFAAQSLLGWAILLFLVMLPLNRLVRKDEELILDERS